ncbi:MAG TPA: hypothetical protein VMH00_08575 [Candidatus Limnocylindrales bacterium]|nr:hypothetical protein [Candidatus Limnocylindrales bacterium]
MGRKLIHFRRAEVPTPLAPMDVSLLDPARARFAAASPRREGGIHWLALAVLAGAVAAILFVILFA